MTVLNLSNGRRWITYGIVLYKLRTVAYGLDQILDQFKAYSFELKLDPCSIGIKWVKVNEVKLKRLLRCSQAKWVQSETHLVIYSRRCRHFEIACHCGIKVYKSSEYLNIEQFTICRVHSKSSDINICNILVYVLQLSFLKPILISDDFQGQ